MKIGFQADNDFNKRIIDALLRLAPEIDFKTAPERGLHHGTPDEEVLRLAAEEGRLLVSHDFKTMPQHFGAFIAQHTSPGLILISQRIPIKQAADELHLVWGASEAEEYVNRIYRLPHAETLATEEL
jgi:hypothetical protein